ncbi:hypothetical protein OJ997_07000 [Solirubrobacter phytolaccae]|uniref:Bacterial Ig domain-containing protein n=1 Tax=Solirubrobacter phytolaccae TaxID=1404360 RepID=A0A9X3N870_9ACTN|nr:hypothetical protein [Solirubrobacter phytolaccae]MDA0180037.1 hypothetical protein [Solirubrobacter phytolaccae]
MARTWKLLGGAAVAVLVATVVPAGAQACSLAVVNAQVVAPAESASIVQTGEALPIRVKFGDSGTYAPAQVGIARMNTSTLPPLGASLPAEVGTVVETVPLTFDPATGTWGADANGNDWALTPGEYVWQASATLTVPAPPPPVEGQPVSSCGGPFTLSLDGRWVHRFTVLGASAVTTKAGKARAGRAKVSGQIAKTFPGKVRLTVACPGKRERTTFVPTADGRWSRTVLAKRGCTVKAAVAARTGWAASEASARVT